MSRAADDRIRRRRALAAGLALALVVLLAAGALATRDGGASGGGSGAGRATGHGHGHAAAGTPAGDTRRGTLVDPDGDGILQRGPGEALRDRTALGPVRPAGRVLTTVGQLTDAHVRDEESPALVSFLDRLGGPFTSTFRPQEALTSQVLTAAVRSLDAAGPAAVLVTGDLIDDDQRNELGMALAALDGGTVRPDSGAPGYDGVQRADDADPSYYRPDVDPPQLPGLLTDAQRAFRSPGLRMPWWGVTGNHDLLVSGEIASTPRLNALATGDRALVRPPRGLRVPRSENGLLGGVDALLAKGLPGQTTHRAPDLARAQLAAGEVLARLRSAGHARGTGPALDYTVDLGPRVRAIVLDTVRRDHGSGGLVTPATLAFLQARLAAAGSRWVLVVSHQPLSTAAGGDAALAALDADARVLATIAGHTHRSRIVPRRRGPGPGFWQITTASLVDFPQQTRMLRVRETAGGGAVIETWMLDTAPSQLADDARALAYLDAQGGRPDDARGTRLDRNVRLFRRAP